MDANIDTKHTHKCTHTRCVRPVFWTVTSRELCVCLFECLCSCLRCFVCYHTPRPPPNLSSSRISHRHPKTVQRWPHSPHRRPHKRPAHATPISTSPVCADKYYSLVALCVCVCFVSCSILYEAASVYSVSPGYQTHAHVNKLCKFACECKYAKCV